MQPRHFASLPRLALALWAASVPAFGQFMRGKVVMADGSAPAEKAIVERVCPGAKPVQEAVANKRGEYIWRIANESIAYRLVTIGRTAPLRCNLRARTTGLESNQIDIGDPVVLNNPELPTLILRPAGQSSPAPLPRLSRAAMKSWELGTRAITAQQWPEAERYLREVVRAAPGFGLAWSGLGYALQSQQKPAEARDAYRRAIEADPGLLLARVQLTRTEVAGKLWKDATGSAAALIAADSGHRYPEAHLHLGLARYMLRELDAARAALAEAIRLDPRGEMPQAEYLMGAVLAGKGDRTGGAEHLGRYLQLAPAAPNAAYVREQIARLTRPVAAAAAPAREPALPVPDELLPAESEPTVAVTGQARVPGGRKALAAIARLPGVPEPEAFFPDYCRAVAAETWPLSEHHVAGYTAALDAFLESASQLADMGERRGDRTEIVLSLAAGALPRTERVLALLGWKVTRGKGGATIEPGERTADGPHHPIARALGIDEAAMRATLARGEEFRIEVLSENLPLAGGSAWGALLPANTVLPGGVAQGFVRQPRLARTCAALGRLEPASAIALARRMGLRTLVNLYADPLWVHGETFRTAGGRAVVPGGAAAEAAWSKLAGASPRDAAAFFEALLKADRGRLAPFYAAIARGDAPHQAWFTKDAARLERFYGWFTAARPGEEWRGRVFRELPLEAAGGVRYPGGRAAWTQAADDLDALAPAQRMGGLRVLHPAPAVDLEALLELTRLESERGRPLDAETAALLTHRFAEWRALFPYFAALPALGASELQALSALSAAAAAAGDSPARQALAAEWHSLTGILVLARRAGSLGDDAAARAFGELCRTLAAPRPEAAALAWLRRLAGGAGDPDEGVVRLLGLKEGARAGFDRVRELQHAPRLAGLPAAPEPAALAAALGGVVYGALLPPDGLLVNEDRRLLAKHVWTPRTENGRAEWFAAASFVPSNSGEGSHFAGGFAGFAELARGLASGGIEQPLAASAAGWDGGAPLFRADARLVEVHATVTDQRGTYLDRLEAASFTLRDSSHAVPLAAFEPATAPISCALVLDTSESMDAALPALKSAAAKLIGALRPLDPVAVYTVGGVITELQPFTTDHATAARAVERAAAGGETPLYDALIRVNRDLAPRKGKKVMVVFTDGEDNASTLTGATAIQRARGAGVPIYTVALGHALSHSALARELAGMARATGGLAFTIGGPEEIAGVFRSILDDLLNGYLLAFRPLPAEDRGWRRIEVEVRAPAGHTVRAREGYYPE